MGIIQRYDIPGGDIPTTGIQQAAPVEDFPMFHAAQTSKQIAGVSSDIEKIAIQQLKIKGFQNADNLAAKAAIDLDAGMKDILESPARMKQGGVPEGIPGVVGSAGDEQPSGELGLTAMVTPKSETIVEDTKALFERVKAQYSKDADSWTSYHLNPKLAVLEKRTMLAAQSHQYAMQNQEAQARTQDYIYTQTRQLMTTTAPVAEFVDGSAKIDPERWTSYVNARREVIAKIADDVKIGALRANLGEKMKEAAVNHIDHEAAQRQMVDNPGAWNSANLAKQNGWVGKLTGEQMEKLNNRATALINAQEHKDEVLRKRDAAVITKDFLRRTSQEGNDAIENPLTEREVIDHSTVLGPAEAKYWVGIVRELKGGAWGDNPDVTRPLSEEAMDPARASQQTINRIQAATRRGGFSTATADKYIGHATQIIHAREGRDDRWNFHDYGMTHSQVLTDTSTPSILGGALDTQANGTRRDATAKLMDYADQEKKAGRVPDFNAFYHKVLQPEIVRGMGNLYAGHSNNLTRELTQAPESDPKTGIPTPEGITASKQAAFERWGIKPDNLVDPKTGKLRPVPDGLHKELETLEKIKEISDSRRALQRQGAK